MLMALWIFLGIIFVAIFAEQILTILFGTLLILLVIALSPVFLVLFVIALFVKALQECLD